MSEFIGLTIAGISIGAIYAIAASGLLRLCRLLHDSCSRLLLRRGQFVRRLLLILIHNEQNYDRCQRDNADHDSGESASRNSASIMMMVDRVRLFDFAPGCRRFDYNAFMFRFSLSHDCSPILMK